MEEITEVQQQVIDIFFPTPEDKETYNNQLTDIFALFDAEAPLRYGRKRKPQQQPTPAPEPTTATTHYAFDDDWLELEPYF